MAMVVKVDRPLGSRVSSYIVTTMVAKVDRPLDSRVSFSTLYYIVMTMVVKVDRPLGSRASQFLDAIVHCFDERLRGYNDADLGH